MLNNQDNMKTTMSYSSNVLNLIMILVVILFGFLSYCFYRLVVLSMFKKYIRSERLIEETQEVNIINQADDLNSISSTSAVDQSTEKITKKHFVGCILSPEWKSELSLFFKAHFGAMTAQIDTEMKYRAVIRLIFLYGTRVSPKDVMYLGWPEVSKSPRLARIPSLRYLILVLTGEEMPETVKLIFEQEWRSFCDKNSRLSFSERKNSPNLGYFVTHIAFSKELDRAIRYHHLHISKKQDLFDPITETDRRRCRVILGLKYIIMNELLKLTKSP